MPRRGSAGLRGWMLCLTILSIEPLEQLERLAPSELIRVN